jgi:hypothetical protein
MDRTTREQLQDAYLRHLLEGMGGRELEQFFIDTIGDHLDRLTDADLLAEIDGIAPELLEPEA